jgi:hypothetical protein
MAEMIHKIHFRRQGLFQGDQIGRIFAYLAIIYFEQIIENYTSCPNLRATLSTEKSFAFILTKRDWATCWAILAKTHLVTLDFPSVCQL